MNRNYSKLASILVVFTLIISASSAELRADQQVVESSSNSVEQGEITQTGLIERITDSLSLTASNNLVGPSDTITFDAEVTPNAIVSDVSNTRKVVEFYRCDNGDCTDPNTFIESDSQLGNFDSYVSSTPRSWTVDYTVPTETGQYEAVAYIFDTETTSVVSTTSVEQFEVIPASFPDSDSGSTGSESSDSGSSYSDSSDSDSTTSYSDSGSNTDDSSNQADTRDVEKKLSTTPYFAVDQESNTVTGNVIIANYGSDDMLEPDIVEMQVREGTSAPLSFASQQDTCDPSYPNNVHKEYQVDSGDAQTVSLSASNLEDGKQYTVYFLTRSGCNGDRAEPIPTSVNAGTFTLEGGNQGDSSLDEGDQITDRQVQDVVSVGKPRLTVQDGTVSTTVTFKNRGGAMPDPDLLEMQVRPEGLDPLSFSSTQDVCDVNTPQNVNRDYQLGSGEKATTTLSTQSVEQGKSYTVYLITRQSCGDEFSSSDGQYRVGPFADGIRVGTADFSADGNSVNLPSSNLLQILLTVSGLILLAGGVYLSLR